MLDITSRKPKYTIAKYIMPHENALQYLWDFLVYSLDHHLLAKSNCLYDDLLTLNTQHVQQQRAQPQCTEGRKQIRSLESQDVWDDIPQGCGTLPSVVWPSLSCLVPVEVCPYSAGVGGQDSGSRRAGPSRSSYTFFFLTA